MAFFTPPGIVNQVKAGKIRALAVTTSTRSPDLPDVPTLKEVGIDIDITNWNGFFLPAGTPQPIVDKLTAGIAPSRAQHRCQGQAAQHVHQPGRPDAAAIGQTYRD